MGNLDSTKRHVWIGLIAIGFLFFGFGVWATGFQIAGALIVPSQIEAGQKRQVVEHLEGGIVSDIFVDEGDWVRAGDPLIQLDTNRLESTIAILQRQLFEITARRGRLISERNGADSITFDAKLLDIATNGSDVQSLLEGQTDLFKARQTALRQETDQINERRAQIDDQLAGLDAQNDALSKQLVLLRKELLDQEVLLKKGLARSHQVRSLLRDEADLQGQIGSLKAARAQASGRQTELEIEATRRLAAYRERAIETLRDIEVQEVELIQTLNTQRRRLEQMTIRAPVSGHVHGMSVFSEKSVIIAAEPLLYIVPKDASLRVVARVAPTQVDEVYIGQSVDLRLSALDQKTTPPLMGVVAHLSADTFADEITGKTYYRVEVRVDPVEFAKLPDDLVLRPGLPVDAFLRTKDRTPLTYLLEPFTNYFSRAMRES
ncbi:MAG: HlyD family type I secretion periplasmic adaptor subunit [Pseudomonadota bacterium]|nr:HlyD family type I secretion periplasmic adaptor subunit [Pseudomonadota bacterium]